MGCIWQVAVQAKFSLHLTKRTSTKATLKKKKNYIWAKIVKCSQLNWQNSYMNQNKLQMLSISSPWWSDLKGSQRYSKLSHSEKKRFRNKSNHDNTWFKFKGSSTRCERQSRSSYTSVAKWSVITFKNITSDKVEKLLCKQNVFGAAKLCLILSVCAHFDFLFPNVLNDCLIILTKN